LYLMRTLSYWQLMVRLIFKSKELDLLIQDNVKQLLITVLTSCIAMELFVESLLYSLIRTPWTPHHSLNQRSCIIQELMLDGIQCILTLSFGETSSHKTKLKFSIMRILCLDQPILQNLQQIFNLRFFWLLISETTIWRD
jgi:hypothetical protein